MSLLPYTEFIIKNEHQADMNHKSIHLKQSEEYTRPLNYWSLREEIRIQRGGRVPHQDKQNARPKGNTNGGSC